MKCSINSYKISIGMVKKGLDKIGFNAEDIMDIIRFIDNKYKNIK